MAGRRGVRPQGPPLRECRHLSCWVHGPEGGTGVLPRWRPGRGLDGARLSRLPRPRLLLPRQSPAVGSVSDAGSSIRSGGQARGPGALTGAIGVLSDVEVGNLLTWGSDLLFCRESWAQRCAHSTPTSPAIGPSPRPHTRSHSSSAAGDRGRPRAGRGKTPGTSSWVWSWAGGRAWPGEGREVLTLCEGLRGCACGMGLVCCPWLPGRGSLCPPPCGPAQNPRLRPESRRPHLLSLRLGFLWAFPWHLPGSTAFGPAAGETQARLLRELLGDAVRSLGSSAGKRRKQASPLSPTHEVRLQLKRSSDETGIGALGPRSSSAT